jgi:hypothetical protein
MNLLQGKRKNSNQFKIHKEENPKSKKKSNGKDLLITQKLKSKKK